MTVTPYLHFSGDCELALRFYGAALDGEITALHPYEGSPLEADAGDAYKNKVMHAVLVAGGVTIMGSDNMPGHVRPAGASVSLSLAIEDAELAQHVFDALASEGRVDMPFQAVFWGGHFGTLTDRFGIAWQLSSD